MIANIGSRMVRMVKAGETGSEREVVLTCS
jgi:hypothetical protein